MKKVISIFLIGSSLLCANSNIENSGSFINNGTINNTQTNTYEGEKAKFDTRIKKLSANILNNPSNRKEDTVILESAIQANQFNISTVAKKEKCIEHALSFSFIKVGASFARKECTKIFN